MRKRDRERIVRNYLKWSGAQWTRRGCALWLILLAVVVGAAMILKNDPAAGPMNGVPSPAPSAKPAASAPTRPAPARKPATKGPAIDAGPALDAAPAPDTLRP